MSDSSPPRERAPAARGSLPSPGDAPIPSNETLLRHMKTAGAWLLAFAIFSAINTLLPLFGLPIQLVMGLTSTDALLALGLLQGTTTGYIAVAINAVVIAAFALLGLRARRLQPWAPGFCLAFLALDLCILVGLMLYGGEFTIMRPILDLIGFGFVWLGVKSARVLAERRQSGLA